MSDKASSGSSAATPPAPPGSPGSSPTKAPSVPKPKEKEPAARPRTGSMSGEQSGLCLTRLYRDRVERFKAHREKSKGGLSINVDTAGAAAAPPSPAMTPVAAGIDKNSKVNRLPRGGFTVETAVGPVQVGAPPETIKDHMSMGSSVPTYFVVPHQRFDKSTFVNLGEIEFPSFFNFFVLRKRVIVIAMPEAIKALRVSFKESLLGPEHVDTSDEFDISVPESIRPDLRKELDWFSRNPFNPTSTMTVETLVDFVPFTVPEDGSSPFVDLGEGVVIRMVGLGTKAPIHYNFEQSGAHVASIPDHIELPDLTPAATQLFRPFQAPTFGFTFLGTSHGFDPNGQTTGFVIWINGQGVMVDPPPHSSVLLQMMGVPPRMVDTIILTHCHADHDAGTLQKILEEGQVTVMATNTVISSFVRKYASITGMSEGMLRELFTHRPVRVGAFMPYRSAHFRFFYSLHVVPCTGFECYLGGQSMVYSADTFNDPEGIEKMHKEGVLSAGRRSALINFPWHHSVVLHEAGVPPIHTPVSYLASLPEDTKRRIRLVHVAPKSVPVGQGLQLAKEGPEHTIRIPVELPPLAQAVNLMDLVSNVRFLEQLSLADARQLLQFGHVRTFGAGAPITVRHARSPLVSKSNEFFMVASGIVKVEVADTMAAGSGSGSGSGSGAEEATRQRSMTTTSRDKGGQLTVGDYFPRELLAVQQADRDTAVRATKLTVTAQTTVQCVVFNEVEFWTALTKHGLLDTPASTETFRMSGVAMELNSTLASLTSRQKRNLRRTVNPLRTVKAGELLWSVGEACENVLLLNSGQCEVVDAGVFDDVPAGARYAAGALFVEVPALRTATAHVTCVQAVQDCTFFCIPSDAFLSFLRRNPSLLLSLCNSFVFA